MCFNYSKLLGRMKECGYTQAMLAEAIKKSVSTINKKLKNEAYFSSKEMLDICRVLNIPTKEIDLYFFT